MALTMSSHAPAGLREPSAGPSCHYKALTSQAWDSHLAGSRTDLTRLQAPKLQLGSWARERGRGTQPGAGAPPTTLATLTLWTTLVFSESWPKHLSLAAFLTGSRLLSLLQ